MVAVRVAIPAMDELELMPATLDALAKQQTAFPFEIYICVNQPESYWFHPEKRSICEHNRQLMVYLQNYKLLTLHVLNRSSRGKGWTGKKTGVGQARKILFAKILEDSAPDDIIVSLDADTIVKPGYLQSVAMQFINERTLNAIAVPYYHPLNLDEPCDKSMLRYEIYMRNYAINLLNINSPYGFTALGSAIATRAKALAKIGNITPLQSGEDFYLVQKFCKMGGLRLFNTECVYPAGRYSNRVPFGTGPAMSLGREGVWDSYPIYPHSVFEPIKAAYDLLPELYANRTNHTDNEFLYFLQQNNKGKDIWADIRNNVKDFPHFVKAFHQKADGLRILQFVRTKNRQNPVNEDTAITENLKLWFPGKPLDWLPRTPVLTEHSVEQLDRLRNILFEKEQCLRKTFIS